MNSYTIVLALILLTLTLTQSAPVNDASQFQAINSPIDISGQAVRQKRADYQDDYYICYPSKVVYGYHNSPNALEPHRRSSEAVRRYAAYDSFDARKDRADRERAAYTDSFGK